MKCPTCKTEMTCLEGEHHYKECGLDNIYLVGIEIHKCSCGEEIVNIPAITELQSLVAIRLIKKKTLLDGKEIKFLRKNAGLTAKRLGEIIGIDNSTISRWENDSQAISRAHDRLLRIIYANIKGIPQEQINSFIQEDFVNITPEHSNPQPFFILREQWSKVDICFHNQAKP